MSSNDIHVAVAVIKNQSNEVLISLRAQDVHQGGLWEFPGGKVESGESVLDALKREISEELDIEISHAKPFKIIRHVYSDKTVVLDVWLVDQFSGEPRGAEGQVIKWELIDELNQNDFPAANRSIINSLVLPERYMITGLFSDLADFKRHLEGALEKGISLVQLRCNDRSESEFLELCEEANLLCDRYNARLLLNTSSEIFHKTDVKGLHLNGRRLHSTAIRPVDNSCLLSVSCHTVSDLEKAEQINADIILLSPVNETSSHPGVSGMGWEKFSQMSSVTNVPVFALGGMSEDDLNTARSAGAKGVAAISSFWKN